jgi:hypothetical protein
MTVVDFGRSYIFFTTKGRTNTARLTVEARCVLTDERTGQGEEFFFFASCKAEDTYASGRLFRDPNYDFCGFFSERQFRLIRAPATYSADLDSAGPIESYFETARLQIRADHAEVLPDRGAIVRAALAGRPLVGRTEIAVGELSLRAVIEYPIKTINVHPETGRFQVDTGPIPFPDATVPAARASEQLKLAFVAYNRLDAAEFILQQPTPVLRDGRELCRVLHYSDIRELPAQNMLLALDAAPV